MHNWSQCIAIESTYTHYPIPQHRPRIREAAIVVASYVSDGDRANFHKFTCLGIHNVTTVDTLNNVAAQIRFEAGVATSRELIDEFDLPLLVADNAEFLADVNPLGLPLQPTDALSFPADEELFIICCRVRDQPTPLAPARVVQRLHTVTCNGCKEDCWQDPLSKPDGRTIEALCLACARRRLIADRHRRPDPNRKPP